MVMQQFFQKASQQNHPLRTLEDFLKEEEANRTAKKYDALRFVGYVLDIGFDTATIITSDPFKTAVGGVPRNSLLVMVPDNLNGLPLHFSLLRVLETAPTPLKQETAQTFFELHKKSMPELDVFTQAELQWGALQTQVLGMLYAHPEQADAIEFAGDVNNFVSAHRYRVYAPTDPLLDLIVNALVPTTDRFVLGGLRMTENRLPLPGKALPKVDVSVSASDFKGTRTALFGKTRLGKSNIVKLIAEALILGTDKSRDVGMLIFDADGEYSNDNPQDGNASLRSAYPKRCQVYAITPKTATPSKELRLDFYRTPQASLRVLATLLKDAGKAGSSYVANFLSVDLPDLAEIPRMPPGDQKRAKRKIQMYWAILKKAGYNPGQQALPLPLDPEFNQSARQSIYANLPIPAAPTNLDELFVEFEKAARTNRQSVLQSTSNKPLFDADDLNLLNMLSPASTVSTGPTIISPFRKYHSAQAGDFVQEIISLLDQGQVVLLDLGNAAPEVMEYFSNYLTEAVFRHQVDKFSNNALGGHSINLFFEEAHNLFPSDDPPGEVSIYRRIAKEGAKFRLGLVYSTQSPSTINRDLLAQTENFFVVHLSSQDETRALAKVNVSYQGLEQDILATRTPGYARMLTRSHRFVVPVQARKFTAHPVGISAAPAQAPPASSPNGPTNGTLGSGSSYTTSTPESTDLDDLPF